MTDTPVRGWVFFDQASKRVTRLARLFAPLLRRRGIRISRLQSRWARRKLATIALPNAARSAGLHLLFRDGTRFIGGDAIVRLAGEFAWSRPFHALVMRHRLLQGLTRLSYRLAAMSTRRPLHPDSPVVDASRATG